MMAILIAITVFTVLFAMFCCAMAGSGEREDWSNLPEGWPENASVG